MIAGGERRGREARLASAKGCGAEHGSPVRERDGPGWRAGTAGGGDRCRKGHGLSDVARIDGRGERGGGGGGGGGAGVGEPAGRRGGAGARRRGYGDGDRAGAGPRRRRGRGRAVVGEGGGVCAAVPGRGRAGGSGA